jgi:ubiquitin carboxyl-terminal hydrolase 5/13
MIKSVMLAQSAFNDSTVQEWELELASCAHTKNLDQSTSSRIADKSMAHCGDCDLKQNLWLCMACGHLGCGRKNYDGTGGNNHAVDHAKSSHHPVVCKLGTITPQGTASIHCYDCDDEVLDDKLGEHLGKLGIDIQT